MFGSLQENLNIRCGKRDMHLNVHARKECERIYAEKKNDRVYVFILRNDEDKGRKSRET